MLTGKDVYEAGSTGDTASWQDLDVIECAFYELVAEKLNEAHIAPLQGNIETLQEQNARLTADMKALRDLDRKIFDDQEREITDWKALVKDYHATLVTLREGKTLMSDSAFALEKRMRVLLEGEIRG